MTVGPEDFFKRLEESGLLNDSIMEQKDRLQAIASGEDVAADLVGQKLLTEYQSEVLLSGVDVPMVVGDYVVTDSIGRGGMGYVLKARHRRMKRTVAIKFLLKSLTESDDLRRRFEREVEAAAQLDHQNIVTAYDAGVHEGSHYLVMQYVDGDDLSHIVKSSGPLDIPDAVDVIRQAAMGLGYAHERGIVHRDIKPGNLLLDKEGVVRILDMGLARMTPSPGDELEGGAQADLTNTGSVMGTIDYMAPEQALDAKSVDHRADVYALGCTLYFLVTGNPPFRNDTVMRRLLAHREEPAPRISAYRPEAPPELDDIFATMMAKAPDDRFPSMKHLVVALDNLELSDAEDEQMATMDMPDDGSGGFISLPEDDDESVGSHTAMPGGSGVVAGAETSGSATARLPGYDATILETSSESSLKPGVKTSSRNEDSQLSPSTEFMRADETIVGDSSSVLSQPEAERKNSQRPWKVIIPVAMAAGALIVFLATRRDSPSHQLESLSPIATQDELKDNSASEATEAIDSRGQINQDRLAAEWVLSVGGNVGVDLPDGTRLEVKDQKELPDGPFALMNVSIQNLPQVTDDGLMNLRGCSQLASLYAYDTAITDQGLANLTDEGREPLPNLKNLFIARTAVTGEGLSYLAESKELTYLDIESNPVSDGSILRRFRNLETVGIALTKIPAEDLSFLRELPELWQLSVDGRQLRGLGGDHVSSLSKLRNLLVRYPGADFDGAILRDLKHLARLELPELPERRLDELLWSAVAALPRLDDLSLGGEGVEDAAIRKMPALARLRAVKLKSARKQLRGETISAAVLRLPALDELVVSHNALTDDDAKRLESLTQLARLTLTGNEISAAAIASLHNALPECRIISDHGSFEPSTPQASNWALSFDGVDDFVDIPSLQHEPGTSITIEATISGWGEKYGMLCGWRGCAELVAIRDQVGANFGTTDLKKDETHKQSTEMPGTRTVRLALVYDGSEGRLFANGKLLFRRKLSAPLRRSRGWYSSGFTIGAASFGDRGGFMAPVKAVIDEVRVSQTARYDGDYVPEPELQDDEHTVALYHFDEGQGNVLKDSSGNGHDGVINGAKWVSNAGNSSLPGDTQLAREAIEWLVSTGGWCTIKWPGDDDGKHWNVTKPDEIPDEPFVVLAVGSHAPQPADGGPRFEPLHQLRGLKTFHTNSLVTPEDLEWLKNSPDLEDFVVHERSSLNDDWAVWLQQFSKLRRVPWGHFGDAGLAHLSRIRSLEQIGLHRPATPDGIRQLASLPNLWSIDLQYDRVTPEIVAAVAELPAVRKLIISWRERIIEPATWKEIEKLTQLETLWLVDMNLDDSAVPHLQKLTNLRDLQLNRSGISAEGVERLRRSLPLAEIRSDHGVFESAVAVNRRAAEWLLEHNGGVGVKQIEGDQRADVKPGSPLPEWPFLIQRLNLSSRVPEAEFVNLRGLHALEEAYLNHFPLTDAALANLQDSINLRVLHLEGTQITDEGLVVLQHFRRMTGLMLPSGFTESGLARVLELRGLKYLGIGFKSERINGLSRLSELPELYELSLNHADLSFDDDGPFSLAALGKLSELETLHLGFCRIDSRCLQELASITHLTDLVMRKCQYDGDVLDELTRFEHLEKLQLPESELTDATLPTIYQLTNLKSLNITQNKLTPDGIATLRKSLPGCRIVSDHGTFELTRLPGLHALQFDDSDDIVEIPLTYDGSYPITIEAWVKPAELGTHTNVIGNRDGLDKGLTLKIDTRAGNNRWAFLGNQASDALYVSSDGRLSGAEDSRVRLNEWTHLAGIWDGQRTQLFIDGKACRDMFVGDQKVADDASLELRQSEANFIISGSMNPFSGQIRSVRISKNVRYKDDFTPESNLSADDNTLLLYSFDESVGNTLRDTSGNGHHGKISGAKWVSVIAK